MADIFESSTVLRVSFNEADGTTTPVDSSALANTLVPHDSVVINTGTSAHYSVAGNFPNGSWYEISKDASWLAGDFTIEAWVILDSWNTNDPYNVILARQDTGGFAFNFGLKAEGPQCYMEDVNGTSFHVDSLGAGFTFNLQQWHHVAVCRSGATCRIFVDGVMTGTSTGTTLPIKNLGGQPYYIGRIGYSTLYFLNGRMCDLRVTSAARYMGNFAPPAPFGLPDGDPLYANVALLLKFDGADGATSVVDQSPYARTMTRVGTPALKANIRKFGTTSSYFSNSMDAWGTATDTALDLNTDFTLEAWVYQVATGSSTNVILSRRGGSNVFNFSVYSAGVALEFWEQDGTYNLVAGAGTPVPMNQWVHVAVCRIGNTIKTYRNGALENTMTGAPVLSHGLPADLAVGRDASTNAYYFPGYIDDVRITKGVSRYTGPFTPPDSLPYYSSLVLRPVSANWFGQRLRRIGFDGNGRISGTTKLKGTPADTPVSEKVRLIREKDGLVVGEVWSNPATGEYAFDHVDSSYRYTVVSYDRTHGKRAVIADNLTPELIT
ncbi:LamG domain-containing protein [Undibacterium sp. Di26W]|uniref:LamG domain-containing protein n=1 Tax=Undibacterium sp. Di26W TaxID=3413035 RepID=UPI003BEF5585